MSTRRILFALIALLVLLPTAAAQEFTPTPQPTFPLDGLVGVPVEGNINDLTPEVRYSFNAAAGTVITLTMVSTSGNSNLDPLLILLSPTGAEVARNDNASPDVREARIETTLPTDGAYTIQATRAGREAGVTSGSYALELNLDNVTAPTDVVDPLDQNPSSVFAVPFTLLNNQNFGAGTIDEDNPRRYFVIGGSTGNLLRVFLTVTDGDLVPQVNILSRRNELAAIGEEARPRDGEVIAFATLPERNWYLIEVTGTFPADEADTMGTGAFSLFVEELAVPQIEYNTVRQDNTFTPTAPSVSFVFEGTIQDFIFVSATVSDGEAAPEIRVLDIAQRVIATAPALENRDPTQQAASLQTLLPRTGTYILQVNNINPGTEGTFVLRLSVDDRDVATRLSPQPIEYNSTADGTLGDVVPQDTYIFEGNEGEIITARMNALDITLDPFLLLLDENLNELTSNDNTPGTRNAQIFQFRLPDTGTYYLLAARSGLATGNSSGAYGLSLEVGEVELIPGSISATLRWQGSSDLNLFIREPSGRIISWSNPGEPVSGTLQIDSNTDCAIISDEPVEHIYWDTETFPESGDYEIWVWYQDACGREEPARFSFQLTVNGAIELDVPEQVLEVGERFNVDIRVLEPQVFILDRGRVTQPSPQQRASEGGDIPILFGQSLNGTLNDEVYARFYQFEGIQGEEVVITAETLIGNLDPVLVLRNNEEINLNDPSETDDRSARNRDSRVEITLPYTGRYVVAVTRFGVRDGLTSGDYRLTLSRRGEGASY
ncbi:MAG: PPC domain-containing protein [Chloroflexota bacterium]